MITYPIDSRGNLAAATQPQNLEARHLADQRIGQVYRYSAGLFAASLTSAYGFAKCGMAAKFMTLVLSAGATMTTIGITAVGVGLIAAAYLIPKERSFLKWGAVGLFAVYQGLILSPMVLLNAGAFAAAGAATVAVVGGLGALALHLETQFERFEKIMLVALGGIALASLGAVFLSGAAGAFASKLSYIGGFALFGAYVIYDTQKLRHRAELQSDEEFDLVHHTLLIYQDAINIFVRMFQAMNKNDS